MLTRHGNETFLLNLIDTPGKLLLEVSFISKKLIQHCRSSGHVDFSWEVLRSLTACQGALLLVDASRELNTILKCDSTIS